MPLSLIPIYVEPFSSKTKVIKKALFGDISMGTSINSCSSSKETYTDIPEGNEELTIEKPGAQLWAETCILFHLAPSPADYNYTDWTIISLHMKIRANLVDNDIKKIQEFLQSAN